jgi:hypothetical protein
VECIAQRVATEEADGHWAVLPSRVIALGVVFNALQVRQNILVTPSRVAQVAPVVVLGGLATHPQHAIDRGGPAEHPATRPEHLSVAEIGLRLGIEAPQAAL